MSQETEVPPRTRSTLGRPMRSSKPTGFFDRNPALDVPPTANGHCHDPGG